MSIAHLAYVAVAVLVLVVLTRRERLIPEGEKKDIRTTIVVVALSIVFMLFGVNNSTVIIGIGHLALAILAPGFLLSTLPIAGIC